MNELRLIGDIGGTNARFAIAQGGKYGQLRHVEVDQYPSLQDALSDYLQALPAGERKNLAGVLDVAGPVLGDRITMTNKAWSFSVDELKQGLGLASLDRRERFRRDRARDSLSFAQGHSHGRPRAAGSERQYRGDRSGNGSRHERADSERQRLDAGRGRGRSRHARRLHAGRVRDRRDAAQALEPRLRGARAERGGAGKPLRGVVRDRRQGAADAVARRRDAACHRQDGRRSASGRSPCSAASSAASPAISR